MKEKEIYLPSWRALSWLDCRAHYVALLQSRRARTLFLFIFIGVYGVFHTHIPGWVPVAVILFVGKKE